MTHIFKKILKLVFPQNILYFNLLCGYAEVGLLFPVGHRRLKRPKETDGKWKGA